jgi:transcriptional regulator with XRE-family HTH domain
MQLKDEIRSLRESTGMSRQEFARYFEIPYRTLQDWELGNRSMPEYLFRLMEYKTRLEGLCRQNDTLSGKDVKQTKDLSDKLMSHTAYLSNIGRYTVFRFRESRIKFIGPYSLERYDRVKEWDNGYLVVLTKYTHFDHLVDEYIDLAPVLDHLLIDKDEFLRPIHNVEVSYD